MPPRRAPQPAPCEPVLGSGALGHPWLLHCAASSTRVKFVRRPLAVPNRVQCTVTSDVCVSLYRAKGAVDCSSSLSTDIWCARYTVRTCHT